MTAMKVKCDNCDWSGDSDDAELASDMFERHETGMLYSSDQCPDCGALCYPEDVAQAWPYIARENHVAWVSWLSDRIGRTNAVQVAALILRGGLRAEEKDDG